MTFVIVNRNQNKVSDVILDQIIKKLPEIIASTLSTTSKEGMLMPEDIKVKALNFSPLGINIRDVEIVVCVRDFAEVKSNLRDRRLDITKEITPLLPIGISGYVMVLPLPLVSLKEFSESLI